MKFTSDIKKILKKTYKSIKKGLNSFLTTLGFNKKETYDLSQKISEKINKEISEYYKTKGVDEETKKSFDAVMLELKTENETTKKKKTSESLKQHQTENYKKYISSPTMLEGDKEIVDREILSRYNKINLIAKPPRVKKIPWRWYS